MLSRVSYAVIAPPSRKANDAVTVPALFVLVGVLILVSVFLMMEVLVLFVWLLTISNTVSTV